MRRASSGLPSFSKPSLGETLKSDALKGQKVTPADFLAVGGGILAGCVIIFTVISLDSLTQGTRHTDVPSSCHDPPLECWDAFSKANGGIMCPVMYQDTYIRGELVKAGTHNVPCNAPVFCANVTHKGMFELL